MPAINSSFMNQVFNSNKRFFPLKTKKFQSAANTAEPWKIPKYSLLFNTTHSETTHSVAAHNQPDSSLSLGHLKMYQVPPSILTLLETKYQNWIHFSLLQIPRMSSTKILEKISHYSKTSDFHLTLITSLLSGSDTWLCYHVNASVSSGSFIV